MSEKEPLVSVIIPARNEAKNIARLLKSIKLQTYKRTEIIVVDDQSTDKTVNLALKFTSKVYKRKHQERSAQRNFGETKAKGQYLLFLDADMELTSEVIEECVKIAHEDHKKLIVIPEKTVGNGLLTSVRRFEREMYMGDTSVEVARFFDRKVFKEFGGYDLALTGPEDYDLPYRISKKYNIARGSKYILHHEDNISLYRLLKRKYYYAERGAIYASKHPELVKSQGNLLFRKAYLRNWRKFLLEPGVGVIFIFVRTFEAIAAILGFIKAVGIKNFIKTLLKTVNE